MTPTNLGDEFIRETLGPYGICPDHNLCSGIRTYISTLLHWNSKTALTTIVDPEDILRVHFGESFFAGETTGIVEGRVADIGTGPGFPGIPIRMVNQSVELALVEPVAKKTAFLHEVVRKLGLSGVDIIRCRMEDLPNDIGKFDVVTSRALGNYDDLLQWSKVRLSQNGIVVLMIGEEEAERLARKKDWHWSKKSIIPRSRGKFVLSGSPKL